MKKVSVIIPVYNTERYIRQCMDSLLNQTYPNKEFILVEDNSQDHTLSILKQYQNYSNVILLENNSNRGVGYSRNRGIEKSTGDYLMFVDSDDVLDSRILEQLVLALEQGNANMSICGYDTFLRKIPNSSKKDLQPFKVIDIEKDETILNRCSGACWAKLFKRSLFENLRFPEGIFYEDAPVTFPAMISARIISFLDFPLYHYRFNLNGVTKKSKMGPNKNVLDLYKSCLLLDRNYKLVRRNNFLDNKMKELGYNILFIGVLNSGFWFQMKNRKYLANSFLSLANQRYGYYSQHENYSLERRVSKIFHFAIRIKYLDCFVF